MSIKLIWSSYWSLLLGIISVTEKVVSINRKINNVVHWYNGSCAVRVLGYSWLVVDDKCPHPLVQKVNALNFSSQIHARHGTTQRASYERGRYLRHVPRKPRSDAATKNYGFATYGTTSYVTSLRITWPIVRPLPELYFSEL